MKTKTALLIHKRASAPALASWLTEAGWEVVSVREPADIGSAPVQHRCAVGVVLLDDAEPQAVDLLEAAVMTAPIPWVAVVPRSALDSPPVRLTIAQSYHDYHTLPVDRNRLLAVLGHAAGKACLAGDVLEQARPDSMTGMVGRSPPMLALYRSIEKVARFEAPVMISGESGTGKEVTARAIHRLSARRRGPFVPVNCGALPANLVHSELFGHEKGSFTGAYQRKIGSIEAADGGIVFLDEIGDLPLELQSSLLRFLQEKTIVRVGSTQHIRIDVRVIAATHVDLQESVKRGKFREDLYYRLNVLPLHVPSLRERGGDIALLAQAFFRQAGPQKSPQVSGFSHGALAAMEAYAWPGNVRELMNRVQKAMIMCDKRLITATDLGLDPHRAGTGMISLRKARVVTERDMIHQTLLMNRRNKAAAARQLGVSRTTLYRLLHKLEIAAVPIDPDAAAAHHSEPDAMSS